MNREEFEAAYDRGPGCWLWRRALQSSGYGVARWEGRNQYAHRLAWELTWGPIPPGLFVCHACDTPACVRPDHLLLGTSTANAMDASRKGRMLGRPGPEACPAGHAFDEANTYWVPHRRNGRQRFCRTCARARQRSTRARRSSKTVAPLTLCGSIAATHCGRGRRSVAWR